jgi:hypothetical protein
VIIIIILNDIRVGSSVHANPIYIDIRANGTKILKTKKYPCQLSYKGILSATAKSDQVLMVYFWNPERLMTEGN